MSCINCNNYKQVLCASCNVGMGKITKQSSEICYECPKCNNYIKQYINNN